MDENQNPSSPKMIKIRSGVSIDPQATEYTGVLQRVKITRNNTWHVVVINGVDCAGVIPDPKVGAMYHLKGSFTENKQYNSWCFNFKSYTEKIEAGKGLVEYLSREAPGLGYKLAAMLVTNFKDETIRAIAEEPGKVLYILGDNFSPEKALELRNWAVKEQRNSSLKESLYAIGLTPSQVTKLIKHYGGDARQQIMKDCFSLTEVHGFGFKTVSAIADLIGIPKTDKGRIKSAILHCIGEITNQGNTCAKISELTRECCALLSLSQDHVNPILSEMISEGIIFTDSTDFHKAREEQGIIL